MSCVSKPLVFMKPKCGTCSQGVLAFNGILERSSVLLEISESKYPMVARLIFLSHAPLMYHSSINPQRAHILQKLCNSN